MTPGTPGALARCGRATALFFALVVVLLTLCGSSAPGLQVTGDAVQGMESFDRAVAKLIGDWNMAGAAIGVVKDGRLVFARGYGWADKENKQVVQPDSLFRIASLSKQITAVTVMALVEQGKLGLEDKAFHILSNLQPPVGSVPDPRLYEVTIRHLLEHAGGWDNEQLGYDPQFDLCGRAAVALNATQPASAETIVRYMMGVRLSFPPGSDYSYSNFGYNVLGRVIEEVTGEAYESYVKSRVLAPMGITRMQLGRTLPKERAAGEVRYYARPGSTVQSVFPGGGRVPWPYGGWSLESMDSNGGWIASAIDIVRFIAHVDGRTPPDDTLRRDSIALMTARPDISTWAKSAYYYGLGWLVRPTHGDANWWHTGSLDGTTAFVVRAYNGLAWCALFNSRPASDEAFKKAVDRALWDAAEDVTSWPTHDLFGKY
jgi:CubicO group peptidase (beta-lactamase class C family)